MTLPLQSHRYGEHAAILPPGDATRNDRAPVDLDTRIALYRAQQEMRQFEKRAYTTCHASAREGHQPPVPGHGGDRRRLRRPPCAPTTTAPPRTRARAPLARGVGMTPVLAELLGRANGLLGGRADRCI